MFVLVVDDELSMREYLEVLLSKEGHRVRTAASASSAYDILKREAVDVVVSDMRLGQASGMDVLRVARARPHPPEVILITAFGTPSSAVEAMREGAYDYICKPFDNEELKLLVQKALEKRELLSENSQLRERLSPGQGAMGVGQSERMKSVWALVDKVSASRSTVLITGESGTGKELIARSIHTRGARASQPFVAVNCGALNEGVLESELFGHVKGAFTGAISDRVGLMAAAGEGTVLLDEIGEMPLSTQVKLLRVLQERKVKPVGSSTEQPFHARVVAATNRRLDVEVKQGRFREDLLYRLNVITVELPPLRERPEDVLALAEHFLSRQREEVGRPLLRFSDGALNVLSSYPFPGNVRQLENIVERAVALTETDLLGEESLPPALRGESVAPVEKESIGLKEGFSLETYMDELERTHLVAALQQAGGQKTRAAQLLGLSFRSFRYRLAKHGLSEREDVGA